MSQKINYTKQEKAKLRSELREKSEFLTSLDRLKFDDSESVAKKHIENLRKRVIELGSIVSNFGNKMGGGN
jgi:hypothetical protein